MADIIPRNLIKHLEWDPKGGSTNSTSHRVRAQPKNQNAGSLQIFISQCCKFC